MEVKDVLKDSDWPNAETITKNTILHQPFSKLYKYKKAFQHHGYKKLSTVE